jgi:hypothetical protein
MKRLESGIPQKGVVSNWLIKQDWQADQRAS